MMLHHRRKAPGGGKTKTKATARIPKPAPVGSRANPWGAAENAGKPGASVHYLKGLGYYYESTSED
jgi:hypothetical protein